jgi:hypothetical protein
MEETMNNSMRGLLAAVVFALPTAAFSQSSDVKYCGALVAKYDSFLNQDPRRGEQPQGAAGRAAAAKCKAGDTSGIPDLEKALKDAKLDLPPRP